MEKFSDFIARKNKQFQEDLEREKLIKMKDIGREGFYCFLREAWDFKEQHNLHKKVFCIERLRLVKIEGKVSHKNIKIGDVEYRFGYYIVGSNGRAKGKWVWGQFCPIIPKEDLGILLNSKCLKN